MCAILSALLLGGICGVSATAGGEEQIPEDFPRFVVPGHEAEMDSVRRLFWLHYPGSGPKATLWDDWLPAPSLWPGVESQNMRESFQEQWSAVLSGRLFDDEGYVATHQHASIAHPLGWPFPFWRQGKHTWGWHFSLAGVPEGWHGTEERTQEQWTLVNGSDEGIRDQAWHIRLSAPDTTITTPPIDVIDTFEAPFLQLRWTATGLGNAQPFVQWMRSSDADFGPDRRFYFEPIESRGVACTVIPVYRHPNWTGRVTRLRIHFNNRATGGDVGVQAFFTTYDTRHNINNQAFVEGCAGYFFWTRDLNFLRRNINGMRKAIRWLMTEFDTEKEGVIVTRWVGHDGRSGLHVDPSGRKTVLHGRGIGGNYWDLLPFGHKDAYATIRYYDALLQMAAVEDAVLRHPEWGIPGGALALDPNALKKHAARVKRAGNRVFWNRKTQRFVAAVDIDGVAHDYGFTFLNLEAIHYGFADEHHARAIMSWICGERVVDGDTSTGEDIYHWRFGPRATTRRNVDYYFWAWNAPESIPWGGQVQDGGAVLGFSYHDLMSRLIVIGPDDAARRLGQIVTWFDEVTQARGYRKYYDGSREGLLQGGGTPGGLGLDFEFFESVLVPQVMIRGFLGFRPTAEGCRIHPRLPKDWPELTITRIRIHDVLLTVCATHERMIVSVDAVYGVPADALSIEAAPQEWRIAEIRGLPASAEVHVEPGLVRLPKVVRASVSFERTKTIPRMWRLRPTCAIGLPLSISSIASRSCARKRCALTRLV